MNDPRFKHIRLRVLFENMVRHITLSENAVLKNCPIPGYYIPETKTLCLSANLSEEKSIKTAYAVLLKHLQNAKTPDQCRVEADRVFKNISDREIAYTMQYMKKIIRKLHVV